MELSSKIENTDFTNRPSIDRKHVDLPIDNSELTIRNCQANYVSEIQILISECLMVN